MRRKLLREKAAQEAEKAGVESLEKEGKAKSENARKASLEMAGGEGENVESQEGGGKKKAELAKAREKMLEEEGGSLGENGRSDRKNKRKATGVWKTLGLEEWEVDEKEQVWRARQSEVKRAFQHAWTGYSRFAWGHDEVRPQTNETNDSWVRRFPQCTNIGAAIGVRCTNYREGPSNSIACSFESIISTASKEIAASSVKLLPVTELEPSLRQQSAFVCEQEASLTQSSQSDSCKAA
eukprot:g4031.t1